MVDPNPPTLSFRKKASKFFKKCMKKAKKSFNIFFFKDPVISLVLITTLVFFIVQFFLFSGNFDLFSLFMALFSGTCLFFMVIIKLLVVLRRLEKEKVFKVSKIMECCFGTEVFNFESTFNRLELVNADRNSEREDRDITELNPEDITSELANSFRMQIRGNNQASSELLNFIINRIQNQQLIEDHFEDQMINGLITFDVTERNEEILKKKCSICLEQFTIGEKLSSFACLHSFHHDCIVKWIKEKKSQAKCPICAFDHKKYLTGIGRGTEIERTLVDERTIENQEITPIQQEQVTPTQVAENQIEENLITSNLV